MDPLLPNAAKVAVKPGPHTLVSANGRTQLRVQSLRVSGGSLVAGTSLDQVTKTIDQVEVIVAYGSIAVVLLIGLGVFVVLRRGLRPIEAMARQADRITAGDLADRVTPHSPRSEVGRLGTALNGMLALQAAETRQHRPKLRMTTARLGESCMRMQTKSYAPSGHYSAESIAFSRYSLAMLAVI